MRKSRRFAGTWGVLAVFLFLLLVLSGCSGGGSSGPEGSSASTVDDGSSGKVGILLKDGPADDYDHIWVTVTEVSLLPSGDCEEGGAVVVFTSEEGYRFDLLQYRDKDFLLTLKEGVPIGKYAKIRLKVSKVEAEGGPCNEMEIKVPSGKIDLEARQGCIEVSAGATVYVRLDIDANKSINLHEAGNSGKCIFRPVVFVDILDRECVKACPTFIRGKVKEVIDEDKDGVPESFIMYKEMFCMGCIKVKLDCETLVFTEAGAFGSPADITEGQRVLVQGVLSDGCIEADLVALGDVLKLKGTVEDPVSCEGFSLTPDTCEELTGPVDVALCEETPLVSGCGEPVDPAAIAAGTRVVVIGKYDTLACRIVAAIVIVEPEEVSGTITAAAEVSGGYSFTIRTRDGECREVCVTGDFTISVEGGCKVDMDLLKLLSFFQCHASIIKKDDQTEVKIIPGNLEGEVTEVDPCTRTLMVGDTKVLVMPLATGIDISGEDDCLIPFRNIEVGDHITCFGVEACSWSTVEYYTFAYLIRA